MSFRILSGQNRKGGLGESGGEEAQLLGGRASFSSFFFFFGRRSPLARSLDLFSSSLSPLSLPPPLLFHLFTSPPGQDPPPRELLVQRHRQGRLRRPVGRGALPRRRALREAQLRRGADQQLRARRGQGGLRGEKEFSQPFFSPGAFTFFRLFS